MKIHWDGLSRKQDYALKWKISRRNGQSLGKTLIVGKTKLLDVLFHVVELHGQEMLVSVERKCSCLLNACCILFLIVVRIGKHTSNRIPASASSVKGTGGVRKHWWEMGRPVLLYEFLNLFAGSCSLLFSPGRWWCRSSPGCPAGSTAPLPLGQRFGLNNPIKLCSLYNSLGLRQQPD